MLQKWYRQFLKKHRLVIVMYGSAFMLSGLLAIGISYQLNQLVMENGKWMALGICLGLVVVMRSVSMENSACKLN